MNTTRKSDSTNIQVTVEINLDHEEIKMLLLYSHLTNESKKRVLNSIRDSVSHLHGQDTLSTEPEPFQPETSSKAKIDWTFLSLAFVGIFGFFSSFLEGFLTLFQNFSSLRQTPFEFWTTVTILTSYLGATLILTGIMWLIWSKRHEFDAT